MTDLPKMSETCRCGSSLELVGDLATDARMKTWRSSHRCLTADETPQSQQRAGAGSVLGFTPVPWDHDTGPVLR